ncbi:MAG: Txe/YoeB family addiction module toxin [Candidatus Ornithomonoglobus sp.]
MNKLWTDDAWDDYIYWSLQDKKTLKRINQLLKDIDRNGNRGIGKPEPLKHEYQGFWSRRINEADRLVYKIENGNIIILHCRGHYE